MENYFSRHGFYVNLSETTALSCLITFLLMQRWQEGKFYGTIELFLF
jgi:hypothetical protein